LGLSQAEFLQRIDVSLDTIRNLEHCFIFPSTDPQSLQWSHQQRP
jgi:transcriptional regulator with XRE-family HTH domain